MPRTECLFNCSCYFFIKLEIDIGKRRITAYSLMNINQLGRSGSWIE